jgi:hypothetical protein
MSEGLPPDDEVQGSGDMPDPGRRKDGKPFKDGNTRDDGTYEVGRNRPPAQHRFSKDDGRKRGKRVKGAKNVGTIWRKKLSQKIRIGDKSQTAAEWLVEAMIRRGITNSDRAAETSLSKADHLDNERESQLGKSDAEIIETWLADRFAEAIGETSDDADTPLGDEAGGENDTFDEKDNPHEN